MTVSPSAGTTGPSTSLSDGGWLTPRLGGMPPAVRNRARSVIVCSRPARAALSAADGVEGRDAGECLLSGRVLG